MIIFAILGLSVLLCLYCRERIVRTLPIALLTCMVGMYIVALCGLMQYTFIILIISCILLWGLVVRYWFDYNNLSSAEKKKNFDLNKIKDDIAVLLVLTFLLLVYILIYKNHIIINDGDYCYWATFPTTIFHTNKLPDISNTTYSPFNSYSPIMGLYYFLVAKSLGYISEGLMFVCNNFFYVMMSLPMMDNITLQTKKQAIVKLLFFSLFPIAVQSGSFSGLSVDKAVAFAFGYCIYAIINKVTCDFLYYFRMIVAIIVLVLLKTPAIIIGCLVALVYIANQKGKKGKAIVTMGLALGIPYVSWNMWCLLHGMHDYLSVGVVCNLYDVGTGKGIKLPTDTLDTLYKYVKAICTWSISGNCIGFSALVWMVLLITICLLLWKKSCINTKEAKIIALFFSGFLLWQILHIYMYLFIFAADERAVLASFARYIFIYLGALIYITFYLIISNIEKLSDVTKKIVIFGGVCVLLLNLNVNDVYKYMIPSNYSKSTKEYANYLDTAKEVINDHKLMDQKDNVTLLYGKSESDMMQARALKYELLPRVVKMYNRTETVLFEEMNNGSTVFIVCDTQNEWGDWLQKNNVSDYIIVKQ